MRFLFSLKELTTALALAFFAWVNMVFWQSAGTGWLILIIFIWYYSGGLHKFLQEYFSVSVSLRIRVVAAFLVVLIVGSLSALVALVYRMSPLALAIGLFFTGLFFSFLKLRCHLDYAEEPEIEDGRKQVIEELPSTKVGVFIYLVLIFFGFYFLSHSQTVVALDTPWQAISPHYIWIFFAATLLVGLLIFSRLTSGTILFLLILHGWLLHAYLPLTHQLFYGADGWRHLATASSWWANGVISAPALSNAPANFWQRLDIGTVAYAQFNTLGLWLQKLCLVSPIDFIKNFLPIVWPPILAIVLFEIGRVLGLEKRAALFLVWLAAWPFALAVSGSFSLPVNLSFLFFLIVLWLQMKNSPKPTASTTTFLIILAGLFIFSHTLFFILVWLSMILLAVLKNNWPKLIFAPLILITAAILPALELISHFSEWGTGHSTVSALKNIFINFSGWAAAFGSSSANTGNIFFNQPTAAILTTNFFITVRPLIFILMWVFIAVWLLAVRKMFTTNNYLNNFWIIFNIALLFSYLVSRYFLSGENIFTRRLDATLALLFLLPVGWYLFQFLKNKLVIFFVVFIFSLATTISYLLGPAARAVSVSEYQAMQFVWDQNNKQANMCVLADTYPLLALEQISGRAVVGGGFPINSLFAQPERLALLDLVDTNPRLAITQAKIFTNFNKCYLVGDYNFINPAAQFGDIKVFNF